MSFVSPPTPDPRETSRPAVKYEPRECRLRHVPVWAILTQASGEWAIVNCLDKEPACARCRCAFVTQDGAWPFNGQEISGGDD